jgi:hypothetical protein
MATILSITAIATILLSVRGLAAHEKLFAQKYRLHQEKPTEEDPTRIVLMRKLTSGAMQR